jgi:hypothetical protein
MSTRGDKWKLFLLRLEMEMKFPGTEHYRSLPSSDERKVERHIESTSDLPTSIFLRDHDFDDAREYANLKDTIGNFYFWDVKLKAPSKTPFNVISQRRPIKGDILKAGDKLAKVAKTVWRI